MKDDVQFGVKGGFVLPSQKEYQRVFIGMQIRYQFSNSFYLFNDYSLSIATWSKEGGNSTREPNDQFWVSLGAGFNIIKNLYGSCGYTIPLRKLSASSKEAGYYNEQTSFELQGFINAGVEIYF